MSRHKDTKAPRDTKEKYKFCFKFDVQKNEKDLQNI